MVLIKIMMDFNVNRVNMSFSYIQNMFYIQILIPFLSTEIISSTRIDILHLVSFD